MRPRAQPAAERCDTGCCVATDVWHFLKKTPQAQDFVFGCCLIFAPSPNPLTWLLLTTDLKTRRDAAREVPAVSVRVPLDTVPTQSSQTCGGLRDHISVHPWLILLTPLPTPWSSVSWRQRSGLVHAGCTGIPLTSSQKRSCQSGPHHSKCAFTLHNDYDTPVWDGYTIRENQTMLAERQGNRVTAGSDALPLVLQRLFANTRDNASSCSYWAMADPSSLPTWVAVWRHN